jgi:hypothetical protein
MQPMSKFKLLLGQTYVLGIITAALPALPALPDALDVPAAQHLVMVQRLAKAQRQVKVDGISMLVVIDIMANPLMVTTLLSLKSEILS